MSDNVGIDSRTIGWFAIDNEVVDDYDLGPYAGWLYVVIIRHIDRVERTAFPSLSTLAKECGMSEPTVIKYMTVLIEKNLLRIHQETSKSGAHQLNLYEALPVVKKQRVVNDVNQGGKADLPGVVNDVKCNNTKENKTQEQEVPPSQKTDLAVAAGECPDGWPEGIQKHVALIDAYYDGLASCGRSSATRRYPRHGKIATELVKAGKTPREIYEATRAAYDADYADDWFRKHTKPITMEQLDDRWDTLWAHAESKRPKPRIVVDLGTMEDIKRRQSESRARIIARAEAGEIGQLNEEADDAAA